MSSDNIQSKEALTYLEIYRPVVDGMDEYMDRVAHIGDRIFGSEVRTVINEPAIVADSEGIDEPVMAIQGIQTPRLDAYGDGQLRLPLFERRTPPRMRFANKFGYATRRLISNPDEVVHRPIERGELEAKMRIDERRRKSLAFIFEQIGLEYGITDLSRLVLPMRNVNIVIDPPLEHLGLEVSLVPDPKSEVFQMLVRHAGVCMRGIARKSIKTAYPSGPASLEIPFARLPAGASPKEKARFIETAEEYVPKKVTLGEFRDVIGGVSWQSKR